MTVRVIDRSGWGGSGPFPAIVEIEISKVCPKCGDPRGEPYSYDFYEDGDSYSCDWWNNQCGHGETYEALLEEARW